MVRCVKQLIYKRKNLSLEFQFLGKNGGLLCEVYWLVILVELMNFRFGESFYFNKYVEE